MGIRRRTMTWIATLAMAGLMFSGCTSNGDVNNELDPSVKPSQTPAASPTVTPVKETFGEPQIVDYNLGASEIVQATGWKVPYTVKGTLGVPTGTRKRPVVFVFHGNHPIKKYDTDRYDQGFTYLVRDLARQGYLTVSVDVNAHYVWEHGEPIEHERFNAIMQTQLKAFKRALQGEDAGYGVSLKGRGDLERVSVIGHSRSGQLTHAMAELVSADADMKLEGIVMAAPIQFFTMKTPFPDVPVGIIIPQYDGDVVSLDGQRSYDREAIRQDRKSPVSLVYLYGANHNYFNSKLEGKDDGIGPSKENDNLQERLTAEEQRQFLSSYAVDFLESVAPGGGKGFWNTTAEAVSSGPNVGMLYGHPVLQSTYLPGTQYIMNSARDGEKPLDGSEEIVPSTDVKLKYVTDSYIPNEDETGGFRHPGDPEKLELLSVRWTKRGGALQMKAPASIEQPLKGSALTLYIAADSADTLNAQGVHPAFTVKLTDTKGGKSSYTLPANTPATRLQPGKLLENEYIKYWSTFTPLSTLRIPLMEFEGADQLGDLKSVTLTFDQTDSGALMIGNVGIEKELTP